MDILYLKNKEEGERLDIKRSLKWILNEMSYEDFRKFTELKFMNYRAYEPYVFSYKYEIEKKDDSPKTREEYIKYYLYKLIQNISTEGVELR